ncbi:hypothetical protein [Streptomyces sp. NPDC048434]
MTEWTNPRYAPLVQAWRDAQEEPDGEDGAPVRGFVFPDAESGAAE